MSSSPSRDPLSGVIRQNKKIVGAICLPEEDLRAFIDQFNHCYGPLRMHIDPPDYVTVAESLLFPVGAHRRTPLEPAPPSRNLGENNLP